MKIKRQAAIDYLHKKGYKIGYEESYTITEKGLIDFMVDFAQEQANGLSTDSGQSDIPDVMVLLPDKDILVSELYSRVYNVEYKRRHVMKSTLQDCYYSGYLDCYDELAGNKR